MGLEDLRPFRVELDGQVLATVGLATIDCPELTLRVERADRVDEAKALLVRIAAYVVSTATRLEPGDALSFEGQRVRLEADGGVLRVMDGGPAEDEVAVRRSRRLCREGR